MSVKSLLDMPVTFKTSQALIDKYEHWWRTNGYRNRSHFIRQATDAAMACQRRKTPQVSALLITETNIHLDRISSQVTAINTRAANCNHPPDGNEVTHTTEEILRELQFIRKRVS